MKNQGWIKLHRKLSETSFYNKPFTLALFIHLLIKANHQKHTFMWGGKEVKIEAGQLVTGRDELSKQTGISPQSIRTALVNLKSTNTITINPTTKYSVITVLKWKEYQEVTNKTTNKQPTTNQQLTTYNNDKNDDNDKNNNVLVEKIVLWAYKRARVNPSCTVESFRKSLLSAITKVGEVKINKMYEMEDNAIRFLSNIKKL